MSNTDNNERFVILGSGRCGSSLLAAICAEAGAEFGMDVVRSWDRGAGANEHPLYVRATIDWERSRKIRDSVLPDSVGRRFFARRAKKHLARCMRKARFVKYPRSFAMVPRIRDLGYTPRVIIAYRPFWGYAKSRHERQGYLWDRLHHWYVTSYNTALLQLSMYGGCAVSLAELTDPNETEWAGALATVTGLEVDALLSARERIVTAPRHRDEDMLPAQQDADALYRELVRHKGRAITGEK